MEKESEELETEKITPDASVKTEVKKVDVSELEAREAALKSKEEEFERKQRELEKMLKEKEEALKVQRDARAAQKQIEEKRTKQ